MIDTRENSIERIEEIWAAVSVDSTGEGLCAIVIDGTRVPLLAADEKRLIWVREHAEKLAALTGKRIKLTSRIELEEFSDERAVDPPVLREA